MQTMGFALGGFGAPIMVWGFQTIGWRATVLVVGAVLSSAAWWAAGITGRRPEDTGEPMDGLTTAEADATPNADFIVNPGPVTLAAGELSTNLVVAVVDDALDDLNPSNLQTSFVMRAATLRARKSPPSQS